MDCSEKNTSGVTIGACLELTRSAVSCQRVFSYLEEIARHHRIQASPGYGAAANKCAGLLHQAGVETGLQTYPARLDAQVYTQRMFQEWSCREAWLELTDPKQVRLSDFRLDDMSILQRSAPADWRDRELAVYYVPDDLEPCDFTRRLDGMLLFVENGFDRWTERAAELGAAGILTVSMPSMPPVRTDMAHDEQMRNCCANLSFHIHSAGQQTGLFGFVLTPGQGEQLRKLCLVLAQEGKHPRAHAYVDARFQDGQIENVLAELPGTEAGEILMVAHLCHPKSSVNDNASGAACAMEAMAVLKGLISTGALPPPRRSIRMILVPEFTGTYAYLAQREGHYPVAGLNLDMVAGRQDGSAGPLLAIQTPDSAPSPVCDLAQALMEQLKRECPLGGGGERVPLFIGQVKPYMTGSDHAILSDPTIGAPTVALTQWPEKTYHTSADCVSHIDPGLLGRVSAFAAAYVYLLSSFTPAQGGELLYYTRDRFSRRLTELCRQREGGGDVQDKAGWLLDVAHATCESYRTLVEDPAFDRRLEQEKGYLTSLFALAGFGEARKKPQKGPVPVRRFSGPPVMRSILAGLEPPQRAAYSALTKQHPGLGDLDDQILFWIDGKTSVADVAQKVFWETGRVCGDYTARLIEFFHSIELMTYLEEEEG